MSGIVFNEDIWALNLSSNKSSDTLSVSLPTAQSYLRMETARIIWSADANPSQLPNNSTNDAATIFIVRCITSSSTQLNFTIIAHHRIDHRNYVRQLECSRLRERVRGIFSLVQSSHSSPSRNRNQHQLGYRRPTTLLNPSLSNSFNTTPLHSAT